MPAGDEHHQVLRTGSRAPAAVSGPATPPRRAPSPSALTLLLTGACNFRCRYCAAAAIGGDMPAETALRALALLLPRMSSRPVIGFTGGEPMLRFETMRAVVESMESRRDGRFRPRYALTTNGSRVDGRAVEFLERHLFAVTLSFDGLAQDGRRRGSLEAVAATLDRLLERPRIRTAVNAVFTPRTVHLLGRSAEWLAASGVPTIHLSLDLTRRWPARARRRLAVELARVRRAALRSARADGSIPFSSLRPGGPPRALTCSGLSRGFAVAPDGTVWGCELFAMAAADGARGRARLRRDLAIGTVGRLDRGRLESSLRRTLPRYGSLSTMTARVDGVRCAYCPDVAECGLCPAVPVLAGRPLHQVPRWMCEVQRVRTRDRRLFEGALRKEGKRA